MGNWSGVGIASDEVCVGGLYWSCRDCGKGSEEETRAVVKYILCA
jgi:hypothetical protein